MLGDPKDGLSFLVFEPFDGVTKGQPGNALAIFEQEFLKPFSVSFAGLAEKPAIGFLDKLVGVAKERTGDVINDIEITTLPDELDE